MTIRKARRNRYEKIMLGDSKFMSLRSSRINRIIVFCMRVREKLLNISFSNRITNKIMIGGAIWDSTSQFGAFMMRVNMPVHAKVNQW